jgi:hypothetical protein
MLALFLVPSFVSASTFDRPLSLGSEGPDVSALQTLLKDKGFYAFPEITGYFGEVTKDALAKYQASVGLEAVGEVGPKTLALLNGGAVSAPSTALSSLITALQQLLRNAGFYEVELSGALDPATLAAVQSISSGTSSTDAPKRSGGKSSSSGAEDEEAVVPETPDTTTPAISSIASSTASTTASVSWTTDEASDSLVEYGATASYGSASSSAALSTSHMILLTGLTASTTYHFKVRSADSLGNAASSSDLTLTTLAAGATDTTAPLITSVATTTATTTATVTWTTDEAATSRVDYGTTSGYGTASTSATLVTSHSITLTGLTEGLSYHFRIQSADAAGNVATSSDYRTLSSDYLPLGEARLLPGADTEEFDLWLVWGQSNTLNGKGTDPTLDRRLDARIGTVMRSPTDTGSFTNKIVYAAEPLENETKATNDGPTTGFAKSFGENLLAYEPALVNGRKVLLVRSGYGGTGFTGSGTQNSWNKGVNLSVYDSAITLAQTVLTLYPRAQLRGILWDQGEEDALVLNASQYQAAMDSFIDMARTDLNVPDLPFILTTLSPDVTSYVQRSGDIRTVQDRKSFTSVADDYAGGQSGYGADTVTGNIGINDEAGTGFAQDTVHFSAPTQRTYRAPRILAAYKDALTHNNPGGVDAAAAVPAAITDLSVTANRDGYSVLTLTPPGASGGPSNGGAAIEGYVTEVSTNGGSSWAAAPVRWGGKGRSLTGLTNGLTYQVRTRAYNRAGTAATWSNVATANPSAIDLSAGLLHRIVPVVASNTVVDTVASTTVVKNVTGGNDGAHDYVATNASTGHWGITTASQHPTAVAVSVWHYATAFASSKGVISEWNGTTTQTASILWQGSVSGVNAVMRGGPGAASSAAYNSGVATSTLQNTWVHWLIVIDDDGSGTTDRWRYYRNGTLVSTATAMTRRASADRWVTGQATGGTTNSMAARYAVTRIYNQSVALFDTDKIAALYAAGPGF